MKISSFLLFATVTLPAGTAVADTPKQLVSDFFQLAFVEGKPTEAALKYISADKYIQHNPEVPDGRQPFIDAFAGYVKETAYSCSMKRVLADEDLVAVHSHCKEAIAPASDKGTAVVDIFRVEQGKIVEHWDVIQAVPETANNTNTMF